MREHPPAVAVQGNGCGALRNLADNPTNQAKIGHEGRISVVLAAMRDHPSVGVVQRAGCAALSNLAANNGGNKVRIASEGGIAVVLDAMAAHAQEPSVPVSYTHLTLPTIYSV